MTGGAIEFLQQRIGGSFDTPKRSLTVPTTGVRLLPPSGDRFQFSIFNFGANPIRIQVDELDLTGGGWDITSGGSVFGMDVRNDWAMPTFAYYGYALVGSSDVYIQECLRFSKFDKQEAV